MLSQGEINVLIKTETAPLSADGAKTAAICDVEDSYSALLPQH